MGLQIGEMNPNRLVSMMLSQAVYVHAYENNLDNLHIFEYACTVRAAKNTNLIAHYVMFLLHCITGNSIPDKLCTNSCSFHGPALRYTFV
jgi:hypothetical protein